MTRNLCLDSSATVEWMCSRAFIALLRGHREPRTLRLVNVNLYANPARPALPERLRLVAVVHDGLREHSRLMDTAWFPFRDGEPTLSNDVFHAEDEGVGYGRASSLWVRIRERFFEDELQSAADDLAREAFAAGQRNRSEHIHMFARQFGRRERRRQVFDDARRRAALASAAIDAFSYTLQALERSEPNLVEPDRAITDVPVQGESPAAAALPHARAITDLTQRIERELLSMFQVDAHVLAQTSTVSTATEIRARQQEQAMTTERLLEAMRALNANDERARRDEREGHWDAYRDWFRPMFVYGSRRVAPGNYIQGWDLGFLSSEVGTPEAREKGLKLLRENMTAEQRESYDKQKHFEVRGGKTGRRYRIHHGRQMNIDVLDERGRRVSGLCFLPREEGIVAGDCMLAQKVALESFEDEALEIANKLV